MQDYIISPMVSGIEGDHFKLLALFAIKNKLGGLRYRGSSRSSEGKGTAD